MRRQILIHPDPRLRKVCEPVTDFGPELRALAKDMLDTMYDAPGIGLAAVQVDRPIALIVIDVSETKDQPLCLINPEIVEETDQMETEEGCLSVPGIYEAVKRAEAITVRALDREGAVFELRADGLLSVCIQHEMDHLQGKLFVDYLSRLKRERIRKRLLKQQREQAS